MFIFINNKNFTLYYIYIKWQIYFFICYYVIQKIFSTEVLISNEKSIKQVIKKNSYLPCYSSCFLLDRQGEANILSLVAKRGSE